jgi:peptidoglycan/xylan/chitin deacetylase (PgdA/CDA1 family)
VPAPPHPPGFHFGRIVSGDAWPEGLAPLDRFAAVPIPAPPADPLAPRRRVLDLVSEDHGPIPLCGRRDDGTLVWSIDPVAWIRGLLSEGYVLSWKRPLPSRIPGLDYSRLPHAWKRMARAVLPVPARQRPNPVGFPTLPLDDLVESVRELCVALAWPGDRRAPSPWPEGRRAAVTLTHDLDTAWILDPRRRDLLREIVDTETALGFRGAWYVTGSRLDRRRHAAALEHLLGAGCELAPHGWKHDAKLDYLAPQDQEARMRRIEERFAGLEPRGIRTPWYARSPRLFEVLAHHFAYDSSVPNSSAFFSARTHSGCCSVFPYPASGALWELPLTLPTDDFADFEAGYRGLRELAAAIVARRGVVVVTLHPEPHQSGNAAALAHYFEFLRDLARRFPKLWSATPREIVERYRAAPQAP